MTINLSIPKEFSDLKPRIMVVGVGGAGGNAVNNMIRANLVGCEFVACNTDAQALQHSLADRRIQLGQGITRGLGAGSRPDVGRAAAEEVLDEIMEHIQGAHMVFVTAGMGGGTGTGAAPVIAKAAREHGILTVGVVTKPFHFEGMNRMRLAESGIDEMQKFVDTLLIIPNQNLFRVANERTTLVDAFKMADDVLHSGVRGVTDLMVMPGMINLDFADIRSVMSEMGKAMMGTGEATGERRAIEAAEAAISNPLLDDVSMKGAKGVLINISGGSDMTLFEVDEAANRIREEVDPEANIIFGSTFDERLDGAIRISVVATGIDAELAAKAPPLSQVAGSGPARPVLTVVETVQSAAARSAEPAALSSFINPRQQQAPGQAPAASPAAVAAAEAAKAEERGQLAMPISAQQAPRLAGEVQNGTFIPPRPQPNMGAGGETDSLNTLRAAPAAHAGLRPSPDARPAEARGPARPAEARGPSLLQRIIGAGRSIAPTAAQPQAPAHHGQAYQTPAHQGPAHPGQPALQGPSFSAGMPQQQAQAPAQPTAPGAVAQPRLDPSAGYAASTGQTSEADYLDIPAFLRRQAN
ncbi:MAG TPA: cell division protein FtsZ [Stellaceae bacterium]|jgi:cell division protein FtsZ|nr:cell division protein FtsZ [Stellaceae bacterium]